MAEQLTQKKHIYPHRQIFTPEDQPNLYSSKWFHSTIGLILRMNMVLRGKYAKDVTTISPTCQLLIDYLKTVSDDIDSCPPVTQPQRFGNVSYRVWCDNIREKTLDLCRNLIVASKKYPEGYADLGFNDDIDASITKYREEATKLPEITFPIPSRIPLDHLTSSMDPAARKRSPVFRAKARPGPSQSPSTSSALPPTQPPSLSGDQPSFATKTPSFSTSTPSFLAPSQQTQQHSAPNPLSLHNSSGLRPTANTPAPSSHTQSGADHSSSVGPATDASALPPSQQPVPQPISFSSFRQRHQIQSDPHIPLPCSLAQELSGLLLDSYGNYVRIDYGTGHELAFITFIAALYEAEIVSSDDFLSLGILVFSQYLDLVRKLQTVYWLEPAGSKGAWGLDDYQFLPFLFGTSQLCPYVLPPASAHQSQSQSHTSPQQPTEPSQQQDKDTTANDTAAGDHDDPIPKFTLEQLFSDADLQDTLTSQGFLFAGAVKYLRMTKTGYVQIHSPILFSLASVPSCEVANSGLLRMYGGEVLSKYPVMQHVKFGSILGFEPVTGEKEISDCEHIRSTIQIAPSALKVNHPNASLDAAIVIRQK